MDLAGLAIMLPDRTPEAIKTKRTALGLECVQRRYGQLIRDWTKEDEFTIRWMAGRYSSRQIAAKLGRTQQAVRCRASIIGVRLDARGGGKWTIKAVADLLRVDPVVIARYRMKLGQQWRTFGKRGKRKTGKTETCIETAHADEIMAIAQAILANPLTRCKTPLRILKQVAAGEFEAAMKPEASRA